MAPAAIQRRTANSGNLIGRSCRGERRRGGDYVAGRLVQKAVRRELTAGELAMTSHL